MVIMLKHSNLDLDGSSEAHYSSPTATIIVISVQEFRTFGHQSCIKTAIILSLARYIPISFVDMMPTQKTGGAVLYQAE
jgi:hypothetical protein